MKDNQIVQMELLPFDPASHGHASPEKGGHPHIMSQKKTQIRLVC
jgi:hypothetical protein